MTEPCGNDVSSLAALVWNSRLYSATGGQTVAMRGSEPPVAQTLSKVVVIARTASRRIRYPALAVIGFLRHFKAFGEAFHAFA